jgi:predicted nucleic acid-binding protein
VSFVLDSSVTLAWIYSEETTPQIQELLARVKSKGAWVPNLWKLEVANILEMGVRRQRYDRGIRDRTLADLSQLVIRIDSETDRRAWGATLQLAEAHRLTMYDAAYLELAVRRRLPLATLDRELRRAAGECQVALLGAE